MRTPWRLLLFAPILVFLTALIVWNLYRRHQSETFLRAVEQGDAKTVVALLRSGQNPNCADAEGRPLLTLAFLQKRLDIAQRLLEAGADPNVVYAVKRTPLCDALAVSGQEDGRRLSVEAVRLMLKHHANPCAPGPLQCSLLEWAAAEGLPDMVQQALERGTDVNGRNRYQQTALMYAAMDSSEVVRQLLARGANVNLRDERGATALLWAVNQGKTENIRLLIEAGAETHIRDNKGRTVWTSPIRLGNSQLVRTLLALGVDPSLRQGDGITPLQLARRRNHKEIVRLLKRAGAKE